LCFIGKDASSKENYCDIFTTINRGSTGTLYSEAIVPIWFLRVRFGNAGPRHWVGKVYDQRVTAVTHRKAEEYRRLAQQCLAMACTLSNAEARVSALQMAQVWQRLADEQDRNPGLVERPPPSPGGGPIQPIVQQQQQQVQPKDDDTKE
jgi:hypothetical protein